LQFTVGRSTTIVAFAPIRRCAAVKTGPPVRCAYISFGLRA